MRPLACAALIALTPFALGAQPADGTPAARSELSAAVRAATGSLPQRADLLRLLHLPRRDSAWWVPLASSVVPGYGQFLLGESRFVSYLAVEGFALLNVVNSNSESRRERDRFRGLARDVARAFVPGNEAIGRWEYYEALVHKIESGVWNRTPGTGVFSPEIDLATFNGEVWLRARELSGWPDPNVEPPHDSQTYRDAIRYYLDHAVTDEFRWSWRNAQLEWDLYRRSIRRYNDASRDARQYLALLAVNHALSTVDAFVTLRLRGHAGAGGAGYLLSARFPLSRFARLRNR
jgi:hypothetical protein